MSRTKGPNAVFSQNCEFMSELQTDRSNYKRLIESTRPARYVAGLNFVDGIFYRWHLIIVVPTVRAIIALIVAVSLIPVGVLTIIIRLTLIVITVGRPVIRSTRIVATVGMPCSKGNRNLGFRFRRTQSDKP
jgi:hypothetical protein